MRRILVKEWITLDGVLDAETMDQWWVPYDSVEGQAYIMKGRSGCDAYLLGRVTYQMLAPYWSAQKNDDHGPASWLNRVRTYVVSSTLKETGWNHSTILREHHPPRECR